MFATPSSPPLGVPERLQNASFETAGDQPANADKWGVWGEALTRITDWKPTKNGAAMLAYKHWETKSNDNSGIFQDASNIKAGTKYKFVVPVFLDKPDFGVSPKWTQIWRCRHLPDSANRRTA